MENRAVVLLALLAVASMQAAPQHHEATHKVKPKQHTPEKAGNSAPKSSNTAEETVQDPSEEIGSEPSNTQAELPWKVCYFTNWAQYRPEPGNFAPADIDGNLCTHIYYAFSDVLENVLIPYEVNDYELYQQVNALKFTYPNLKTVLAVGGWTFGTAQMTLMLSGKSNRTMFIQSAIDTIKEHNFNGIDLDFEYPGGRGSPVIDKYLYTCLCSEMRNAIDLHNTVNPDNQLLFTAGVAAGLDRVDDGYEIASISQYLDKVNLMAYDFFGAFDNRTNPHSPLYHRTEMLFPADKLRNVHIAANYWVDNGCPKHKLVIGLAAYGRGFTLRNPFNKGLEAPMTNASHALNFTRTDGIAAYYELCSLFLPGAEITFDDEMRVPYASKSDQWFGYENLLSIREKVKYIVDNAYGGFMLWTIDYDDFLGSFCQQGRYPMLNTINDELQGYIVPIDSPDEGEVPPPDLQFCDTRPNGYHEDPETCSRYYECFGGQTNVQFCSPGLVYDPFFTGCRNPSEMEWTWICDNCVEYCDRTYCDE